MPIKTIHVAHSPDSDDAFMFYALAEGKIDNAAKWSPPGGQVTVTLRRATTWVLEVRDQGPGIALEDLPKVFDRFFRAPTARSMPVKP